MKVVWRKQRMDALGFNWRGEDERGKWIASAGRNVDSDRDRDDAWIFMSRDNGSAVQCALSFDDVKRRVIEARAEK